jgi:hypothetical protein
MLAAKHGKAESDGGTISAKLFSIKIHAAKAEVHAAILGPLPPELLAKHKKLHNRHNCRRQPATRV